MTTLPIDANGNLIQKGNSYKLVRESVLFTSTTGEGVIYWEYSYGLANRLVAVKKNGVSVASFVYDPLGLRIERIAADGQREHYVFNLSGDLVWQRDLGEKKELSYIWWNGEHLAKVEGKPTDPVATRFFYHTDLLGSPMAVTEADGELVWRQDYLPFGERIEQERAYAYVETLGLTGKEYDEATGLYYYNARWYDPNLGRFIIEDPARDGLNWYLYCYGNPLKYIDPIGLTAIKIYISAKVLKELRWYKVTDKLVNELNSALNQYEINTEERAKHFLSQVAHESGVGKWAKELASGEAYEGRKDLGNVKKGDGAKYKGAGYLQLTGRYNYQKFSDSIGDPKIIDGVDYVATNYSWMSAGFWWQSNKMNALVDSGATVEQITRRVNGGLNGLKDRLRYYNLLNKIFATYPPVFTEVD